MALTAIAALICIIIGLIVGAIDDADFLFPSLVWFVLAIAFNTLSFTYVVGGRRAS